MSPYNRLVSSDPPAVRLFTDRNMTEAQVLPIARGGAAVFSARAPDKDGPNEDAAALIPIGPEQGVLVVADGLGGQPGGASASQIALDCLREIHSQSNDVEDPPPRGDVLATVVLPGGGMEDEHRTSEF